MLLTINDVISEAVVTSVVNSALMFLRLRLPIVFAVVVVVAVVVVDPNIKSCYVAETGNMCCCK